MFTQILLYSIISAVQLSLVAIGFSLIFNSTKVFHIAHGALFVTAVYGVHELNRVFNQVLSPPIIGSISIILSLALISCLVCFIEYLVYKPLFERKVNPDISLISSLGVYLLIVNGISFFFGNESITLNKNYQIVFSNDYFRLTLVELVQFLVSVSLIGIIAIFSRTKYYTHIRAITDDYLVAQKFGINIQRTRVIALIAGTLLVGIAGIMKGYEVAIEANDGLTIVLTASIAVIFGGVNSIVGTIMACFIIAVIQNFSVKIFSTEWKNMLTYMLLIIVLIFYRQGLISVKQRVEIR